MAADNGSTEIFRSARLWTSNVYGAAIARIGAVILISVMLGIVWWVHRGLGTLVFVSGWICIVIGTILALYPGKLIAAIPYTVELKIEGTEKVVVLYAPMKKVCIPMQDIAGVRRSFFRQGFIVKFSKRHGLLKAFTIHGGFGIQGQQLARTLETVMSARNDS